jgi:hypothetical protein
MIDDGGHELHLPMQGFAIKYASTMNRRTILKSLVAGPAAVALHAQDPPKEPGRVVEESPKVETTVPDAGADPIARYFSKDQFSALDRLGEILEPSVPQTPGAKEARAADFLDFLLSRSPQPRQTLYRTGLDRLNAESTRRYGHPFAALDAKQADIVLEPLRRPWTSEDPADPLEHFLREAKADIMQATRNSYAFISVVAKRSRGASGVGEFWYPLY